MFSFPQHHCHLLGTGASKPASTANALLELLDFDDLGGIDALEDQLGDPVAFLDGEIDIAVVEEEDLDLAPVVRVNDARTSVDEVLGGKAGAWGNATVCSPEKRERSAYVQRLIAFFEGFIDCCSQVPAGTAMLMSVSTRALPRAGMTVSLAAYRS